MMNKRYPMFVNLGKELFQNSITSLASFFSSMKNWQCSLSLISLSYDWNILVVISALNVVIFKEPP